MPSRVSLTEHPERSRHNARVNRDRSGSGRLAYTDTRITRTMAAGFNYFREPFISLLYVARQRSARDAREAAHGTAVHYAYEDRAEVRL